MTPEERTVLYEDIVKVAPKEMGADLTVGEWLIIDDYSLDLSESDQFNGAAIIAMLDAMEKAGFWPDLYPKEPPDPQERYLCEIYQGQDWKFNGIGATRAEAVARAFIATFAEPSEALANTAPANSPVSESQKVPKGESQ